ncbi:MAG: hypothetical protein GOV01_00135 [Candidatus Altiarchaeota archaeon]|nr:hypothetical protein [Candidatus Altiarchaeota archaeon]
MGLMKWAEEKLKKMTICDIKLIKLGVAAFTLFLAKVWPPLLSLEWYWYLIVFVLAYAKPMYKVLT